MRKYSELLSLELQRTINITSAYAPFVMVVKKLNQILFQEYKIEGKTIYKSKIRECIGCDKFIKV